MGEMLATELFSPDAAKLAWRMSRGMKMGRRAGLAFAADMLSSTRAWFDARFVTDGPANLYAPWALHPGLSPDSAGSGFQVLGIAGAVHQVGLPIVEGGAQNHVRAFERLITDHGGCVRTGVEVERIITRGGTAVAVVADGEEVRARRAVVANTGPAQLYGKLLDDGVAPREATVQASRYRYNERAGTQIHVSLGEPLRWRDSRLDRAAIVHLNGGLDRVSLACAQASAGLLPAEPTVVVGQPTTLDRTRAPDGAGVLWIQLQQVPYAPRGDAAGEIDVADGTWSDDLVTGVHRARAGGARPTRGELAAGPWHDGHAAPAGARATQRQPRPRRPVRRERGPRPVVCVATAAELRVARHPHRSPVPVRCCHLSRPRPPRGIRTDRRPPDPGHGSTTRPGAPLVPRSPAHPEVATCRPRPPGPSDCARGRRRQGETMSEGEAPTTPQETMQPPVVTGRPIEIAPGVFVIPDGGIELVPNVGVIVGDRAALVVDTGLGPRNGAIVRSIAEELAGDRPLFLTLTHWHPEHGFGAQAFADATIVYNRTQHEELSEKGAGYLGMFGQFGEVVARELADVAFVDPHIVYDGAAEIDLGGKTVQLRTWGPGHTREDQGVYLPDEKILFIGDLIECRSFPVLSYFPPLDSEVDARKWISVLDQIRGMEIDTVVPGHGEIGGLGLLDPSREYLEALLSETNCLADGGEDPERIASMVLPDLIARFPEWDVPPEFLLAAGVQSVLAHRG